VEANQKVENSQSIKGSGAKRRPFQSAGRKDSRVKDLMESPTASLEKTGRQDVREKQQTKTSMRKGELNSGATFSQHRGANSSFIENTAP